MLSSFPPKYSQNATIFTIDNNTFVLWPFIRDRPFNLKGGVMVFCFVQNFFFGQHKSSNIIFFCRAKREFFFQNLTLGYMTKILNQIIFFFLHQNRNIFFSNITPPLLQVKWSFPNTLYAMSSVLDRYIWGMEGKIHKNYAKECRMGTCKPCSGSEYI